MSNVAAGPVGRDANADTDALMHAEILAWSRSRGAFAGVALNGTVVERDRAEAMRLYGRPWSNREIIRGGVAIPDPARVSYDGAGDATFTESEFRAFST